MGEGEKYQIGHNFIQPSDQIISLKMKNFLYCNPLLVHIFHHMDRWWTFVIRFVGTLTLLGGTFHSNRQPLHSIWNIIFAVGLFINIQGKFSYSCTFSPDHKKFIFGQGFLRIFVIKFLCLSIGNFLNNSLDTNK